MYFCNPFPRVVLALLILLTSFYIATYLANLIRKKFDSKDRDPLFVNYLSKTSKVALIIVGIILAKQALGLSGIAQGFCSRERDFRHLFSVLPLKILPKIF